MRHIVRIADLSTKGLLTRAQGAEVRKALVEEHKKLAEGDTLCIDFGGVDAMAPSFADECIGHLAQRLGLTQFRETVELTGATETVRALVNAVLADRLAIAKTDGAQASERD